MSNPATDNRAAALAVAEAAPGTRAGARRDRARPALVVPALDGMVQQVHERAGFLHLEAEWEALADRLDAPVFQRHWFIRLWLEHFAGDATLRTLAVRDADGRLQAVLPLLWRRTRLYGVPVRELAATANLHSCRFDLLALDPPAAARALIAHLRAQPDWDVLRLPDVPDGGAAQALLAEARNAGLAAAAWPSIASPFVPLPSTHEALASGLRPHFLANLRRRRRRLEEKGNVTLERVQGGAGMAESLQQGLYLEASGWKGRYGTAVVQDAATLGFYRDLAAHAARRGTLSLWLMRLDGRPIGFHYALEERGRCLLLKPAYDEALRECSPGQLLTHEVLHDCIDRGLQEFDFLGPSMPWKRDWTAHERQHSWLFVFRGARGRLLHALKFRVAPALRRTRAALRRRRH